MASETVKGVVAILTHPDGDVIAHAADFNKTSPGGYEQVEAQKIRARRVLAKQFIENTCADFVAMAMPTHQAEELMNTLRRGHGFKVKCIEIEQDPNDA